MGFRCVHRSECVHRSGVCAKIWNVCTGLEHKHRSECVHRSGVCAQVWSMYTGLECVCTGVECIHRPMSGYESVGAQVGVSTGVDVCAL